jgi:hypothetical protein
MGVVQIHEPIRRAKREIRSSSGLQSYSGQGVELSSGHVHNVDPKKVMMMLTHFVTAENIRDARWRRRRWWRRFE